jgi:4-hydroxy-3-methylbut-2-en-1-yl diphosphate reductase
MYKEETKAIAKLFERAMLKKVGPEKVNDHFMALDTICDATQERQDAVSDLLKDESIDMFLVVGGWDSSNTAHLLELVEHNGKTGYHVAVADNIKEDGSIEHRLLDGSITVTKNFLKGVKTIGLTSGASTPDKFMENALERVFMLQALKQDLAAAS